MRALSSTKEQVGYQQLDPHRRILVVEDHRELREEVARCLESEGYAVVQAEDGLQALRLAANYPPDLVILDLILPGIDGLEVCSRLRAASNVPILMLTGRAEEDAKEAGYTAGADDYLTKPFHAWELSLRVRAIMRRVAAVGAPAMMQDDTVLCGDVVIHPHARVAERDKIPLNLTAKEFDLLHFMVTHPRHAFTRQQLLDSVWHYSCGDGSTVTVHMQRLRQKVESMPGRPRHLRTAWGIGYIFNP
jgi:DNA-binding response OmpR family regulator